jgi:hypothetical protein
MVKKVSKDGRAIFTGGHWEIEPSLVGSQVPLPLQRMNLAERNRIIQQRLRYLDFVHDHFADAIIDPPAGVAVVSPENETGH